MGDIFTVWVKKGQSFQSKTFDIQKMITLKFCFLIKYWYLTRMIFPEIYVNSARKFVSLAKIYTILIFYMNRLRLH